MTRPENLPGPDELLAAYADDPASLTVSERAAVEARCAAEPAVAAELAELRALLGEVRVHGDVADRGPDWTALEAQIKAAIPAPRRSGRWLLGGGVLLAAAAAVALWWHQRAVDDGPGLGLARLIRPLPVAPAPAVVPAPAVTPDPALDDLDQEELDALALSGDDALDDGALDDGALGDEPLDDGVDDLALIGRALERVPAAPTEDDGLFPGLDTEFIDDLSEQEVEQALRWLDEQGAG